MRALHTADWHIGQTLNGWSREAEHEVFFRALADIVEEEEIDLLLVAGDVFDNTNPSGESQRLLYRALADLKRRRPSLVIVISGGNHDPALRLEAPGDLFEGLDIHTFGTVRRRGGTVDAKEHLVPVPGPTGEPELYVLAIPFLRAADLTGVSFADNEDGLTIVEAARAFHTEIVTAAAEIAGDIGPILSAIREKADAFGVDSEERLRKLRQVAEVLRSSRDKIAEDQKTLTDLGPQIAHRAAELAGEEKAEAEATTYCDGRQAAYAALLDERKALLGGEATDTHRSRHNKTRQDAQSALEDAQQKHGAEVAKLTGLQTRLEAAEDAVSSAETRRDAAEATLTEACAAGGLSFARVIELHQATDAEIAACRERIKQAETEKANADGALRERQEALKALEAKGFPERPREDLESRKLALEASMERRGEELGRLAERQSADAESRERLKDLEQEIDTARGVAETWLAINEAIGAANGDRFAQIAQAMTLGLLVERANLHLQELKPRYRLEVASSDLALYVIDLDMAGDRRTTRSLSGGERFLVSLALALALSSMGTYGALAGTLFIDEGFGSLDSDSLDLAIDALERLQAQGRTIGVISHVQAMKDRIPVQVEVVKTGGGASEVKLKVA
ncbi:exonuclease subunit SbcD [Chelativorans sp. AA-79]|uniref:exonuclease subunit SbcD n=1 Tax=Chelativorans sp. AA-79 TaxID=3028735 RepID=UPI0023F9B5FD|nr:exonuclease subunit SbcD [Chelativorans sp. AA-79]WEX12284.1 exonuclease subunit SbcD [Chelativorans sp. AA-79]